MYGDDFQKSGEVSAVDSRAVVEKMVKTPINKFMAIIKLIVSIFSIISLVGLVIAAVAIAIPLFDENFFRGLLGLAVFAIAGVQLVFGILVGIGVFKTVFHLDSKGARMAATNLKRTVVMVIVFVVLDMLVTVFGATGCNGLSILIYLIRIAIVVSVMVLYYKYIYGWATVLEDVALRIEGTTVYSLPVSVSIKGPAITMAVLMGLSSILTIAVGAELIRNVRGLGINRSAAGIASIISMIIMILATLYFVFSAVAYGAYYKYCEELHDSNR